MWILAALTTIGLVAHAPTAQSEPTATPPKVILHGVPFTVELADADLPTNATLALTVHAGTTEHAVTLNGPDAVSVSGITLHSGDTLRLSWGSTESTVAIRALPGWVSLLPPLVAIILAMAFRQVVLALLSGVWLGALLVYGLNPFTAILRTMDSYLLPAVQDNDHVSIMVFSFMLGGMLGVIHRMGGARGIVDLVAPYARSARSGQLATWALGLIIFFDDYANSLLVGNTMRPLTDRLRISREKLSYIVDSTAAPVASIAVVSTWIGFEVGTIGDAMTASGIAGDPFATFMASIPFRFYPIFALIFGFMIALSGRDFGPMLRAERRARSTGEVLRPGATPLADFEQDSLEPPAGKPVRWINLALPVLVVVLGVMAFIYTLGRNAAIEAGSPLDLKTIVGSADSYTALVWASFLGALTAVLLAWTQRILSLDEAISAWMQGVKAMLMAMVILALAWAIGSVTGDLKTSDYLVSLLGDTLSPHWLPVLVFVFSGFTAFATGSSWSTMGILMPLVVPLAHHLAPGDAAMLSGAVSGVLAGAVWGDHCSPISDTTVLSSMASSADHMDHVNTQIPYAVVVALVAMLVGDIPSAFGVPVWVCWVAGAAVLWAILRIFGRSADAPQGSLT